jgi:hypothetical protein
MLTFVYLVSANPPAYEWISGVQDSKFTYSRIQKNIFTETLLWHVRVDFRVRGAAYRQESVENWASLKTNSSGMQSVRQMLITIQSGEARII